MSFPGIDVKRLIPRRGGGQIRFAVPPSLIVYDREALIRENRDTDIARLAGRLAP